MLYDEYENICIFIYMEIGMSPKYDLELYKLKAEISKTLSDPKRLMIISELRSGEKQVGELAQTLEIPQAVVSRQLAILRSRGIVTPRREGTCMFYRLTDVRIMEACDLVHEILISHLADNKVQANSLLNFITK
jgi:ArsR family transcriptional regulator, virulence genes transcriptional regulator